MATRKKVTTVSAIRGGTAINTEGLDNKQARSVAETRMADSKAKMKKKYDKRKVTVGNKSKLQRSAQTMAGELGQRAPNKADLYRSANNAQYELKQSEAIKARERAAKEKKEAAESKAQAAESKPPINYGTPMNYSMTPGSREKDSPGAFRDTAINKHMGAPVNYGTDTPINDGHDKKEVMTSDAKQGKVAKKGKKKAASNKAPRGPQNLSVGGVKVRATTKGRSEQNTDLLEVAKKAWKKYVG